MGVTFEQWRNKLKLKNGDEVEVGEERYRVIGGELRVINPGSPPMELTVVPREVPVRPEPDLIEFYLKKGYDVCPSCGCGREEQGGTGCGKYHYGTYCLA